MKTTKALSFLTLSFFLSAPLPVKTYGGVSGKDNCGCWSSRPEETNCECYLGEPEKKDRLPYLLQAQGQAHSEGDGFRQDGEYAYEDLKGVNLLNEGFISEEEAASIPDDLAPYYKPSRRRPIIWQT